MARGRNRRPPDAPRQTEDVYAYLRRTQQEDMPAWLAQFRKGDPFPREQFFASRVVFYPGCGTDGHAVRVFGSTHSAHCFVYVDYHLPRSEIEEQLATSPDDPAMGLVAPFERAALERLYQRLDRWGSVTRFRGYVTLDRIELRESDITPGGWTPHIRADEIPRHLADQARPTLAPFAFLEVLQREPGYDETHGPRRLAVLFLGADGIATYDALFCQGSGHRPPFAILLHDHGFGGNYDSFGGGGLLERIAIRCGVFPEWLLVAKHTEPWDGFRTRS